MPKILIRCLILAMLVCPVAMAQPQKDEPAPESLDPDRYVNKEGKLVRRVWTTSKLKRWLESATGQYEALPADSDPESHDGRMQAALGQRIEMFKELLATRQSVGSVGTVQDALEKERETIEEELRALQTAAEPIVPEAVDRRELEAQEKRLAEVRRRLTGAERQTREREERIKALPGERTAVSERLGNSRQILKELPAKIAAAVSDAERDYANLLLKNARLEHRLAEEHLLWLEREQELIEEGRELDRQQVLKLQLQLARVEQEVTLYRKAQGVQLEKKKKEIEADVVRKQEAAERASTPQEKFMTGLQARLAREQAALIELEQVSHRWGRFAAKQEKRLQEEKKDFTSLQEITERSEGGRSTGLRLKMTYQHIRERKTEMAQPVVANLSEQMDQFRSAQFEEQESLLGLDSGWSKRIEAIASNLPEAGRGAFRSTAVGLREQLRSSLMEHIRLIDKILGQGERIEVVSLERRELIETLEGLVMSQIFWIRDARPLGVASLGRMGLELDQHLSWMGTSLESLFSGHLTRDISTAALFLWLGLLLLVAPAGLVMLQLRFARQVSKRTSGPGDEPACLDQTLVQRVWTLLLAGLSALPVAVYGVLLGLWVRSLELDHGVSLVLSALLVNLSALLGVWLLARVLLTGRCLAALLLDMQADAARTLYRFIRWILTAYFFLMVPASIWQGAPFEFETLPRICYSVFFLVALVALWPLVRPASPLVTDLAGKQPTSALGRAWKYIAAGIMLVLAGILVLDVLGYRFGAARMAQSAVLSLVTVLVLSELYRFTLKALERSRARDATGAPGEEPREQALELSGKFERFLRTAFVVLGLTAITLYWGLGAGAVSALEEWTVLSMQNAAGEMEKVTVSDLFSGLIILIVTFWIVRNLKGILDVFVFPRTKIASGSRYAILTISRWTLFVTGVFMTLSAIHLDLGRLGWLVAAMGVGIGFGLQEIIANMVSGVILLIERPIRVGDFLSVGDISGEVRRINIRATTILNFDRQEVIVPNKDFITREVTNWTLEDRIIRLTIPIGVAYGSDIDAVRDMLLEIANAQPEVRALPAPMAFFMNHGDSSLDFNLFVYLSRPEDRHVVRDRINTLINQGLAERNIAIPFPQRDLHVRSGNLPVELEQPGAGK